MRSKEFEDRPSIVLKHLVCIAILGLFAAPLDANAQGYPLRRATVVVPFPAGGPSDVVAHIVTEEMGKILGQSMVVENVGGAGGTIGSARVAAANPDGYTLQLNDLIGGHVDLRQQVRGANLTLTMVSRGPSRFPFQAK
jgi:tripartite-type tricarboxylate transporter receptor subunit TctC